MRTLLDTRKSRTMKVRVTNRPGGASTPGKHSGKNHGSTISGPKARK